MNYQKDDFYSFMQLYSRQSWLHIREPRIEELISICETREQKELVFSLLDRFHYLKNDMILVYLEQMADYIINSGFEKERTLLVACTYDEKADSGQKILDMIKVPLYQRGWKRIQTINTVGKSIKHISNEMNQIIIIDEFIGTGKSLRTRVEWLTNNSKNPIEIKCCFMSGMKKAIDELISDSIDIFCPLQLNKGITEFFEGNKLSSAITDMLSLESKLATNIQHKLLSDYSFGYGKAEALYSLENGNTPNSVFPIFWWIKDNKGNDRQTILTRYEEGFE